jgi:hypothetical protein
MKPLALSILLIAFLVLGTTSASLAAPDAPPPPYVGPAPAPGSWTIDVQQKRPALPKSTDPKLAALQTLLLKMHPRLLQQIVQQSGRIRHEETHWEDGTQDVLWFYGGSTMFHPRYYTPENILMFPPGSSGAPQQSKSNFPDLDWIRPETFAGTTTYQGAKCYLYKMTRPPLAGGDILAPADNVEVSAWIDAKTLLPIAVEDPALVKRYTFKSGPVTLELTGPFARAYEKFAKSTQTSLFK